MSTPRFLYHASAVGLSGQIRRPFQHNIDCQASTALPRYGGRAAEHIKSFDLGGVVRHAGVSTELSGVYNNRTKSFETSVRSTVTGLDIEGKLTVELLTGEIHSVHPAGLKPDEQPKITVAGSEIRGLRIAGRDIELVPLVNFYSQHDTLDGLRKYYEDDPVFRNTFEQDAYIGREDALPANVHHFFPWRRRQTSAKLHEHNGMTIVPMFKVKNPSEEGFEVFGNVIRVANFGRFHIGELIIEGDRRRLLMLRAELGSPCEGEVDCSCTDGNGGSAPPPDPPGGGHGD